MKKIILLLAVTLFGIKSVSALHEQFVINNLRFETVSDTTAVVKWVEGILPDNFCDIPAEVDYNGKFYRVTGIDSYFSVYGEYVRKIRHIHFPATITDIIGSALTDCPVTEIILPDRKTIYPDRKTIYPETGGFLLEHCKNLELVDIPECVTDFSAGLSDIPNLRTIICRAPIPPEATDKSFAVDFKKVELKVPNPEAYRQAEGWKLFENIVEIPFEETTFYHEGIKYQFIDSTSVKVIALPSDSKDANIQIFEINRGLTIPSTVTHNGLTCNVTAIGPRALHDATWLQTLGIYEIKHIGKDAFRHCDNLEVILIINEDIPEVEDSVMFPELHPRKTKKIKRCVGARLAPWEFEYYDLSAWNTCEFFPYIPLSIGQTTSDELIMRLNRRCIEIDAEGDWILDIYNMTGAKVYTVSGTGATEVDTESIGSGIYVARLSAGDSTKTLKLRIGD